MDILISHWHCIIPAVAILLALVLLQGKDKDTGKTKKIFMKEMIIMKKVKKVLSGIMGGLTDAN